MDMKYKQVTKIKQTKEFTKKTNKSVFSSIRTFILSLQITLAFKTQAFHTSLKVDNSVSNS